MSFTNLSTGGSHAFGCKYLELAPGHKLHYSAQFDDFHLPGQMQTTIILRDVFCGVEMKVVLEGIAAVIPVEACYLGWQESLILPAQLVEPEIRE